MAKKTRIYEIMCRNCDTIYESTDIGAVFCDKTCRRAWDKKAYADKVAQKRAGIHAQKTSL